MQLCVVLSGCRLPMGNKAPVPGPPVSVFTGSSGHSPYSTCVNMCGVVGLSPDQVGEQRDWGSSDWRRPCKSQSPRKQLGRGTVVCGLLCPLLALSDNMSFILGV